MVADEQKENPGYYAIIPASVRYDKQITANAKLLYGEITALCNKTGYCWASNKYFAALYGVTASAVSGWIKSLESSGYLMVEYRYQTGTKHIDSRKITLAEAVRRPAGPPPPPQPLPPPEHREGDSHIPEYDSHIPEYDSHIPEYDSHISEYDSHIPEYDIQKFKKRILQVNTTSSSSAPPAEKPDPPGFSEEEAVLKQYLKNLDAGLIFDRAFYPKARQFMGAGRLDADYLSWLYEFCSGQKPRTMAGYYYTAFFNPQLVELYREAVRSRPPPPDRPVSCPVCGTGHPADRDCPRCGLEPKDRDSPEAVNHHRRLFALPEDTRGAYERELEVLIRETSRGDFSGYSKRFIELSEKYGLGP